MTSNKDMIAYLDALPRDNMQMRYAAEILTYTVNANTPEDLGPPLNSFKYPVLVFTREGIFDPAEVKALGRPVLLFEGSIHGNESAAMEAMMPLAKRLAMGDLNELLDRVSVVIIPHYNPDGNWRNVRESNSLQAWHYTTTAAADAQNTTYTRINGLDLNRDQTGFESPITRVVQQIWNAYEPHLIADGHQMGISGGTGGWSGHGISGLFTSNPNTPEELDILAHDGVTIQATHDNPESWETADSLTHLAQRAARAEGDDVWYYVGTVASTGSLSGAAPYEYYTGSTWTKPTSGYSLRRGGFQEGNPEEGITDTAGRLKGAFGFLGEVNSPGQGQIGIAYHHRIRAYERFCETMIKAFADPVRGPILKAGVDNARKAMAEGTSVRQGVTTHEGDFVIAIKNSVPVAASDVIPGEKGEPVIRLVRNPALTASDPGWNTPVVSRDYYPAFISRSRYVTAQDYRNSAHTALDFSVVKRPTAYILHGPDAEAIVKAAARIAYTGVRIERLAEAVTVPVEYYTVTGFGQSFQYFRGSTFPTSVPQLSVGITGARKAEKVMEFPKDAVVIYTDQYNSPHSALTMEVAGARNFGNYWYSRARSKKEGFLPVALNQDFPAYRFMGDRSELVTYFAGDVNMLPFVNNTHIEWPLLLTQEEKAGYTDSLNRGDLLAFSSFIVNKHAGDDEGNIGAYLKKTKRPGAWYAWNCAIEQAEVIVPGEDDYAKLSAENIGLRNEVVIFKVLPIEIVANAVVEKLNGNKNSLTIIVTELYHNHEVEYKPITFTIDNNSAGTYVVGPYKVYVDTKGNTQIRACYVVGYSD
jgi:hypothetical protein